MVQEVAKTRSAGAVRKTGAGELAEELNKTLNSFLRGYTPEKVVEVEKDLVDGRYKIDFNSPLPDFNTQNASAYFVNDIKTEERNKSYLALVCDANSLPRSAAISPLMNSPHPNLMVIMTFGVIELSRMQEERLVIVFEKPKGEKLSYIINVAKQRPNFDFICNYIIAPLALAIQHLNDIGIPHGSINCDNVYFDTSSAHAIVIGQCLTEPCGFSQPFYYEPVERMQALPAGKGEGDAKQDYYALAVVILHIIYGMNHFSGLAQEELVKSILKRGAFDALTLNKDMPEVFYDFFRGMLSHHTHDRWNYRYLRAWLDGKRYNLMPIPPPQEAIRPFELNDDFAYTRREVANLFFKHWDEVPEVFVNGHLSTWVAISLRNKELNEYVIRTAKTLNAPGKKNDNYLHEQIMRAIIVFDPAGPIRIDKLSFHLDGINTLFAQMMLTKSDKELQQLMQFIELSMFHFVIDQKNKDQEKREDGEGEAVDALFVKLDRMRSIIRNTGIGFGTERIFYDLNTGIRCLSPLLAGKYVASLSSMLKALDKLAPNLFADNDPIDRHIAAFIASHLGVQHEIHLVSLDVQPTLSKNKAVIALKLLSSAQYRAKIAYLPGLSHWLAIRILPLLDVIRSNTMKKKLITMLASAARSGNISKIAEVIIESGYAQVEVSAFQQASRAFRQNANDILFYKRREMIEVRSKHLGARMVHYIALLGLLISVIVSVRGA